MRIQTRIALALRAVVTAANGKPEDFVALLRSAQGDEAASIRRFAELIDLGVLRQMWRPSSMADVPAALARAQHAIASGEARHPAMKRIEAAEWEAARAFAERVLDALSPFTSKAAEPLTFREWTTAHSAVLARLAELGIGALPSEDAEPSTLADASKVHARSLSFDIAGYAGFFGGISTMRAKPAAGTPASAALFVAAARCSPACRRRDRAWRIERGKLAANWRSQPLAQSQGSRFCRAFTGGAPHRPGRPRLHRARRHRAPRLSHARQEGERQPDPAQPLDCAPEGSRHRGGQAGNLAA